MDGKLEAIVKVIILFLLWSENHILGKNQGKVGEILKLFFCVNHGYEVEVQPYRKTLFIVWND